MTKRFKPGVQRSALQELAVLLPGYSEIDTEPGHVLVLRWRGREIRYDPHGGYYRYGESGDTSCATAWVVARSEEKAWEEGR